MEEQQSEGICIYGKEEQAGNRSIYYGKEGDWHRKNCNTGLLSIDVENRNMLKMYGIIMPERCCKRNSQCSTL